MEQCRCHIIQGVVQFLGHEIFRGNRYSYNKDYGMMLLFDSNGRIAGMQVGVCDQCDSEHVSN